MDSNLTWSFLALTTPYLVSLIVFCLFLEQLFYLKKKGPLPGPILVIPFLGNVLSLARTPTKFWESQAHTAKSSPIGLSSNYIFGKFVIFIRNPDLCHKVFSNIGPNTLNLIAHPFGKKIFGEHSIIYVKLEHHRNIRRQMTPNFSPKALSTYLVAQQNMLLQHLKKWELLICQNPFVPMELRDCCQDINLDTSQTVFVGPYLNSKARQDFHRDYNLFNAGLMSLPLDFPGFGYRKARFAVRRLIHTLTVCVKDSKAKLISGKEPSCLIDFWMQENLNSLAQSDSSDLQIGSYLFDFLYAAQDGLTSSLLWAVTLLEKHSSVLAKIRDEVGQIWSLESDTHITMEQLKAMSYTQAVAKEVLRYRPPAPVVPHIAIKDFPLTESYTIPKGTLIFPSVLESSMQGFTNPQVFDPDRFLDQRQEDVINRKNFLSFGSGVRHCVGEGYALNQLLLFIVMFTSFFNFSRHESEGCDDIIYIPTTSPRDNCLVYLSRRCTRLPSFRLGG